MLNNICKKKELNEGIKYININDIMDNDIYEIMCINV